MATVALVGASTEEVEQLDEAILAAVGQQYVLGADGQSMLILQHATQGIDERRIPVLSGISAKSVREAGLALGKLAERLAVVVHHGGEKRRITPAEATDACVAHWQFG
jgi:hypothetical protein